MVIVPIGRAYAYESFHPLTHAVARTAADKKSEQVVIDQEIVPDAYQDALRGNAYRLLPEFDLLPWEAVALQNRK